MDVQAYMGHANINTTMIYAHSMPKHNAADALSELIDKANGKKPKRPEGVSEFSEFKESCKVSR